MNRLLTILSFTLLSALIFSCKSKTNYKDYTITGPYSHKNLSIFLIHGKDAIDGDKFLTLDEALKKEKLVVLETSNVQELKVKNLSKDYYVFMQSGDIVKGGKQDRVVQHDTIVPPNTEELPIDSFCVEQGRWEQRGEESAATFKSSENMVTSKKMKLAIRHKKSQSEVWNEVSETQNKLEEKLNKSVRSEDSNSSLELSLEDKDLKKNTDKYVSELKSLSGKDSAIGFVSVINGKIHTADIYSNKMIFQKVWEKMLKANAIEALSEETKQDSNKTASIKDVTDWLDKAEQGKKTVEETPNVEMEVKQTDSAIIHKSVDKKDKKKWYRKSYTSF